MLKEFIVWIEASMRKKGEEHSANHMLELLALVEGLTQEEGMFVMRAEVARLEAEMATEIREIGFSARHGELWTMKLNAAQAVRGGGGELHSWG